MLRQRVITAALLLAILLPALFADDPLYFVLCAGALVVAAAWEWGRLSEQAQPVSLLGAAGLGVVCMEVWLLQMDPEQLLAVWLGAALAWSALAVAVLYAGAARWAPQVVVGGGAGSAVGGSGGGALPPLRRSSAEGDASMGPEAESAVSRAALDGAEALAPRAASVWGV